jgi:Insertion element 4 transposase N-terminal/Transposase DDE domain
MARHAKRLSTGSKATEHLSMGVLALCFPVPKVQSIIEECGKASRRIRDLPSVVVVFYVLALNLFPGIGYQSVLRWLLIGLQWLGNGGLRVCGKGALSAARQRLGAAPMRRLHQQMALPLADPALKGCYWKGMHTVALDGSTLALQDTKANSQHFGRSSNQHGEAAYPQARFVALVETGTHLIFAAELGAYRDSEIRLCESLISQLQPGMLCLADRLFPGYELWKKAAATGAHLLWRAKTALNLKRIEELADGSWLARWFPSRSKRGGEGESQLVRVIEYRLKTSAGEPPSDLDQPQTDEVYRLLTTILEPEEAQALELAAFYPQRWEIELTLKEGKSILRHGQLTLRSKIPQLVEQEFWGLLLAHYLVRKMMAHAALKRGRDPDELSYRGSVEILKSMQTGPVLSFPPSKN